MVLLGGAISDILFCKAGKGPDGKFLGDKPILFGVFSFQSKF
jgi:hypothetical protein